MTELKKGDRVKTPEGVGLVLTSQKFGLPPKLRTRIGVLCGLNKFMFDVGEVRFLARLAVNNVAA